MFTSCWILADTRLLTGTPVKTPDTYTRGEEEEDFGLILHSGKGSGGLDGVQDSPLDLINNKPQSVTATLVS